MVKLILFLSVQVNHVQSWVWGKQDCMMRFKHPPGFVPWRSGSQCGIYNQVGEGSKPRHSLEPPLAAFWRPPLRQTAGSLCSSSTHCDTAKVLCTRMWEPYYLGLSVTRIMTPKNLFSLGRTQPQVPYCKNRKGTKI